MLVLTRKQGESIMIGDIELKLLNVGRNRIKLGIEADKEIDIRRGEIPPGQGYHYSGSPVPRNNPPQGLEGNVKLEPPYNNI